MSVPETVEKRKILIEGVGQIVSKSTVPQDLQPFILYNCFSVYENFSFILREDDSVFSLDVILNLMRT